MFTCGTSHYLKHKFGVGYNLTIVKKENCDVNQLDETVMRHVSVVVTPHITHPSPDPRSDHSHQRGR